MEKSEILQILDFELAEAASHETRSGWSGWAIGVACATLIWIGMDIYESQPLSLHFLLTLSLCSIMASECVLLIISHISLIRGTKAVGQVGGVYDFITPSYNSLVANLSKAAFYFTIWYVLRISYGLPTPWFASLGYLSIYFLAVSVLSVMTLFDPIPWPRVNSHPRSAGFLLLVMKLGLVFDVAIGIGHYAISSGFGISMPGIPFPEVKIAIMIGAGWILLHYLFTVLKGSTRSESLNELKRCILLEEISSADAYKHILTIVRGNTAEEIVRRVFFPVLRKLEKVKKELQQSLEIINSSMPMIPEDCSKVCCPLDEVVKSESVRMQIINEEMAAIQKSTEKLKWRMITNLIFLGFDGDVERHVKGMLERLTDEVEHIKRLASTTIRPCEGCTVTVTYSNRVKA